MKKIDLTGQTFGDWFVLASTERTTHWRCRCAGCGKEYDVSSKTLKEGTSKRCRTCSRSLVGEKLKLDLTGHQYGMWTVLEATDDCRVWKCRCQCGKEKNIFSNTLRTGRSISCITCSRKRTAPTQQVDGTGRVYGKWTVLGPTSDLHTWRCRCAGCGKEYDVGRTQLYSGSVHGCLSCYNAWRSSEAQRAKSFSNFPEYSIFQAMKRRCYNPNVKEYPNYGGRGITVCDRWFDSFENFYADMGPRPGAGYSIDRKNTNGNYEPDNCRWATVTEQARNKRNNSLINIGEREITMAEAAETFGISRETLTQRIKNYDWDVTKALTKPVRQHHQIEVDGKKMTLKDAARHYGISVSEVYRRMSIGWDVIRALTTPTKSLKSSDQ